MLKHVNGPGNKHRAKSIDKRGHDCTIERWNERTTERESAEHRAKGLDRRTDSGGLRNRKVGTES